MVLVLIKWRISMDKLVPIKITKTKKMKKVHPEIYKNLRDDGYGIIYAYDELRYKNIEPIDFEVVEYYKAFAKIKIINPSGEEEIVDVLSIVVDALNLVEEFYSYHGNSFKNYDASVLEKCIDAKAESSSLAEYSYAELVKLTNDKRLNSFHHFYSYDYGWHSPHIYLLLSDDERVLKWAGENLDDFSIDADGEYDITLCTFIRDNVKNPRQRIDKLKEFDII